MKPSSAVPETSKMRSLFTQATRDLGLCLAAAPEIADRNQVQSKIHQQKYAAKEAGNQP